MSTKERTKDPKVPAYPPELQPQIAELERELRGGDTTAYEVLTRLAVLWAPGTTLTDRNAVVDWLHRNY